MGRIKSKLTAFSHPDYNRRYWISTSSAAFFAGHGLSPSVENFTLPQRRFNRVNLSTIIIICQQLQDGYSSFIFSDVLSIYSVATVKISRYPDGRVYTLICQQCNCFPYYSRQKCHGNNR